MQYQDFVAEEEVDLKNLQSTQEAYAVFTNLYKHFTQIPSPIDGTPSLSPNIWNHTEIQQGLQKIIEVVSEEGDTSYCYRSMFRDFNFQDFGVILVDSCYSYVRDKVQTHQELFKGLLRLLLRMASMLSSYGLRLLRTQFTGNQLVKLIKELVVHEDSEVQQIGIQMLVGYIAKAKEAKSNFQKYEQSNATKDSKMNDTQMQQTPKDSNSTNTKTHEVLAQQPLMDTNSTDSNVNYVQTQQTPLSPASVEEQVKELERLKEELDMMPLWVVYHSEPQTALSLQLGRSGEERIKEWLLKECHLQTLDRIPQPNENVVGFIPLALEYDSYWREWFFGPKPKKDILTRKWQSMDFLLYLDEQFVEAHKHKEPFKHIYCSAPKVSLREIAFEVKKGKRPIRRNQKLTALQFKQLKQHYFFITNVQHSFDIQCVSCIAEDGHGFAHPPCKVVMNRHSSMGRHNDRKEYNKGTRSYQSATHCKFWMEGYCKFGDKCRFVHVTCEKCSLSHPTNSCPTLSTKQGQ